MTHKPPTRKQLALAAVVALRKAKEGDKHTHTCQHTWRWVLLLLAGWLAGMLSKAAAAIPRVVTHLEASQAAACAELAIRARPDETNCVNTAWLPHLGRYRIKRPAYGCQVACKAVPCHKHACLAPEGAVVAGSHSLLVAHHPDLSMPQQCCERLVLGLSRPGVGSCNTLLVLLLHHARLAECGSGLCVAACTSVLLHTTPTCHQSPPDCILSARVINHPS